MGCQPGWPLFRSGQVLEETLKTPSRYVIDSYVLGIDVDPPALQTAKENVAEAEIEGEIDFVLADVASLNTTESPLLERLKSNRSTIVGQTDRNVKADHLLPYPPRGRTAGDFDTVIMSRLLNKRGWPGRCADSCSNNLHFPVHRSAFRDEDQRHRHGLS